MTNGDWNLFSFFLNSKVSNQKPFLYLILARKGISNAKKLLKILKLDLFKHLNNLGRQTLVGNDGDVAQW